MEITEEITEEAKKRMEAIDRAVGLKFQHFNTANRFIGYIGEIIFERYLRENSMPFEFDKPVGHKDLHDFKINNRVIDVKAGQLQQPFNQLRKGFKFYIAKQQMEKNVDYFVNILISPDQKLAYIRGFIRKEKASKYPVLQYDNNVNPAYNIPLFGLTPIEKFKEEMGK